MGITPFPIKGLPTKWMLCGSPTRAKIIASVVNKGSPTPIYTDGYTSIWTYRSKGIRYGVMSHGMGKPSIDYSIRRLAKTVAIDSAIRLGTAGCHNYDLVGELVIVTEALDFESGVKHHSSIHDSIKNNCPLPNYDCVTTDNFYNSKTLPADGNLEDMETSKLLELSEELGFKALSILLVVNQIGGYHISYNDEFFYKMTDIAEMVTSDFYLKM